MKNAITVVSNLVNLVKSKGMNHCQFKDFSNDMEFEYGDDLYWLSRGQLLQRLSDLKSETKLLVEMKGKHLPQLCDQD
jgi:hypothetical protein